MRTGAEANGEAYIHNQKPPEFSDDWSDGHFELGEWVGSGGVCPAWIVRNASPLNPGVEGIGGIRNSSQLMGRSKYWWESGEWSGVEWSGAFGMKRREVEGDLAMLGGSRKDGSIHRLRRQPTIQRTTSALASISRPQSPIRVILLYLATYNNNPLHLP